MDKLKNIVRSRDNQDPEGVPSSPGRLTGQGSHFPKQEEQPSADTLGLQGGTAGAYVPGTDAKQESEATSTSGLTGPGSGTAAIAETTTYSSHALPQGDTVGSVVDPASRDPTTYKMPEHSYTSSRGVPEGGPLAAAAAAFHKDKDYSTSNLPGAFPQESAYDSVTAAPSVPDASAAAQSALGGSTTSRDPIADESKQTGTVGKILGAVGLGTAAAGAGVATSRARDGAQPPVASRPDQPTTTTGVDSYAAPTQSTPTQSSSLDSPSGSRHHRKESIPTTAYPAGVDSPLPINAPVGGTTATPGKDRDDHTGRNIGLAASGVGAGAIGAHEYEKSRAVSDSTARVPGESTSVQTTTASAVPPGATQGNSAFRGDNQQIPATSATEPKRDSHGHGKTAAVAGLGAGAGANGAHEYAKSREPREVVEGLSTGPATIQTSASTIPSEYQQTPATTTTEPERNSHGYGQTAAAAGVGAGVGAAGAYALHNREPEPNRSDWPLRDDSTTVPTGSIAPTSQRAMESQTTASPTQQHQTSAYSTQPTTDRTTTGAAYTDPQSRYGERQKTTAREETVFAGTGTAASTVPARDEQQMKADEEEEEEAERRRRREKEAAVGGVAGAGAGAAGFHELNKHHHEADEARRQKDLAEQEEARRKQYEKDQKAAAKDAKKEEKAAAKEEKKQQKEMEKEEKKQQKEIAKEEKKQENVERYDREKETALTATGVGTAGATAYAVHDKDKHPPPTTATDEAGRTKLHKDPPEDKKPSLLKRIFRRRKNKDTGEEEEYEDEEGNEQGPETEHSDHRLAATGVGAGTGAGVAATTADSRDVQRGYDQKPSYNPFSKDDPSSAAGHPGTSASAHPPTSSAYTEGPDSQRGLTGADTSGPAHENLPSDPSGRQHISQEGQRMDNMGGLTTGHSHAEGEDKPGLAHRVMDAFKPLPEREHLQQHAEEYHGGGTGSAPHGTTQ